MSATQEAAGQKVESVAWDYFYNTIRNVEGLRRYSGLKAALRMIANQVLCRHAIILPWHTGHKYCHVLFIQD